MDVLRSNWKQASAAALLVGLSACGGGGGGGDGGPTVSAPTKLSEIQSTTSFSARSASGSISRSTGLVTGSGIDNSGSSSATITVDPASGAYRIQVSQASSGVSYDQTFGSSNLTGVVNGIETYIKGGDTLEVLNAESVGLDYTTFGVWTSVSGSSVRIGAAAGGFVTPASAMPTTGSATYSGVMAGYGVEGGTPHALVGTMGMSADFASRSVSGSMNAMRYNTVTAATSALPTMTFSGPITPATSGFDGTIVTSAPGLTGGTITGNFYGPGATETSGVWTLNGASPGYGYAGGFAAAQ